MKAAKALIFVLLLGLVGCDLGEEREGSFERSLQVSGTVDLDVESGAGNITVRTGDGQTVSIVARIRARDSWLGPSAEKKIEEIEANPPIEQHGNTIKIGKSGDRELNRGVVFDYDLTVPPQTELTTSVGAGNQTIGGIQFKLEARSGAGNITVEDVAGDVRVHTGAGNVEISDPQRSLVAESGVGNIGTHGGPKRHWQIRTGAGNIRVRVPANASFNVDAHSGIGRITVGRSFKVQGSISSNHVQGKVGDGGPSVQLENGAGNIDID